MSKRGETAEEIIGAFFLHMGEHPGNAEELLGWLDRAGFEVLHASVLRPLRRDAAYGSRRRVKRLK